MTQSIFCWEHTRVLWEKAWCCQPRAPDWAHGLLLSSYQNQKLPTQKSLWKLHVLYLILWGFLLLRAVPQLPTCSVFITRDDEVRTLLPRSGGERGPHSFTPLCVLHDLHWWDTRRFSSLFRCIDIPSCRRTAWLSPPGAEFWDGCMATTCTCNWLCVWNPEHQQNGGRVCLSFHHTMRLLMNQECLCYCRLTRSMPKQWPQGPDWTAFLPAQTQIPSSAPSLQTTVGLILGWLNLQRSLSIL